MVRAAKLRHLALMLAVLCAQPAAGARNPIEDGLYRVKTKNLAEGGLKEHWTYDRAGFLRSRKDASGAETKYTPDGLNRVVAEENAVGQTRTYTYGDKLNVTQVSDPTWGVTEIRAYDKANRETARAVSLAVGGSFQTTTSYQDTARQVTITHPGQVPLVEVLKRDLVDRVVSRKLGPFETTIVRDALGNPKEVQDPDLQHAPSRSVYDGLGRLVSETDPLGRQTTYEYYDESLLKAKVDRRGVRREYTYDHLGRLTREEVRPGATSVSYASGGASGWSRDIAYDDATPKRTETDARGKSTVFVLDKLGRVKSVTDALSQTEELTYAGLDLRTKKDKRGRTTTYDHDALHRLTKTTHPDTKTTQTAFQDSSRKRIETDRRGIATEYELDSLGRVVRVVRSGVTLQESTYDGSGNLLTRKQAGASAGPLETRYTYDSAHRRTKQTVGAANVETNYTYDPNGNVLTVSNPRTGAAAMTFTYDALNRKTSEKDGEGRTTQLGYDEAGNLRVRVEPGTKTTEYFYDETDTLTKVKEPLVEGGRPETLYSYDPNRNHTQTTDADGRKVAYEYDELNRLFRTRRDPTGLNLTTTTTQFDANGNPERVVEANGEVTIQTWDELNRLKTRRYEPAAGWTPLWAYTTEERYFYNPNSSLERIEEVDRDQAGAERLVRVTTRDYDNLERQTGETFTQQDGSTRAVSTEYWPNGAVKSVTDPAGTTSFTYDGQNREETATTPAGVTTKTYFPDGLVKDVTFPNGTKRAYLYDKADRALSIVTTKGGTLVSSVAYTYDDNGNRLTQVQVNGGAAETTSYTYDALNRLETTTYPADAGHVNGRAVTYGYDHAGNRKTETVTDPVTLAVLESRTGIFDQANRLTQLTDNLDAAQTATLTWDANGNLLSETKAGVTTTYRYDLRNTLGEVQRGAQVLARFLGDFDERRVLKIGDPTRPGGAGTQEYLYHRSRLVSEIEATQPTARYEWTNEELISLFRSDGTRRYYALDGLETVMALTDEQGAATDRLALDVWGVPRAGTDFGTSGNRYAFTSHRYDTETGLYYAGARMYSPAVGRFISQDDVAPTLNRPETWHLFTYGANRPTYYTDPTGHSVWTKAWKVVKTGGRISAIWEGVASDIDAMGRTNRFMDHLGLGLSIATELLPVSAHDVFDTYTAVQDGNYENLARRAASRTGVGRVALGTERGLQATQELAEGNYAEAGKHFAQAAATMGSGRVPRGRRSSSERKGKSGEAETVVEPRSTVGGTKTDPIARPADAPEALPSRPESSPHYSNWFEAQLKEDTFKSSDANHFRQANRQLYERLQNDPDFAKAMERQYPGITAHVTPGPRDGVSDAPPSGLTWHHEAHRPGTLQLVPRPHHQAPGPVQGTLHPDGKGGRENWGGGRRPRPKADEEPE